MENNNNGNNPSATPSPAVQQSAATQPAQQSAQQTSVNPNGNKAYHADNYLLKGQFTSDLAQFRKFKDRKTGYENMDAVQGLHPGLYVLGAISSLGKTTFVQQMSDQIATLGTPVLYFSLEQSALELYSKSLSRRINLKAADDPSYQRYTSIQIRNGEADGTHELAEQISAYTNDVKHNLCVVEANFNITVEEIEMAITDFMKMYTVAPVIVIDYLQIITPSIVNNRPITDPRISIDHIVHSLKSFQKLNNLTVIAICSMNRMNYSTPVDFESFKESGGIEYTADVVWGMQLEIITKEEFEIHTDEYTDASGQTKTKKRATTISEKRQMINDAKTQDVRDIQLVTLKNRYGRASYTLNFAYEPAYDTFTPKMEDQHGFVSVPPSFDPFS